MSLLSQWGSSRDEASDLLLETTEGNLRNKDDEQIKKLFFSSLKLAEIDAIKNILHFNRSLMNEQLHGYEGADVYGTIRDSKTRRCYTYTGIRKDGHFYPLHVAAEYGHKMLCIMLAKAGADVNAVDYRGKLPQEVANGTALHAFFELKGFQFEAYERYEGPKDAAGNRSGQGKLYFKEEGYEEKEFLLYTGAFKAGRYHATGKLFWPKSTNLRYVGRFRGGMMNGRGTEFDEHGAPIYQGTFRNNLRDGKGQETSEGKLSYSGDFKNGEKNGFGIQYLAEGHMYCGRFLEGAMSGIGIYVQPNGDLFEGHFYNNKPDGPGSRYTFDASTKEYSTGTHAVWDKGRISKETSESFIAAQDDLPIIQSSIVNVPLVVDEEAQAEEALENLAAAEVARGRARSSSNDFQRQFDGRIEWKIVLAKYLKLSVEDCVRIGIPEEGATLFAKIEDDSNLDDVVDMHFVNISALYVSYVYVCSAQKVFESRIKKGGIRPATCDFDLVYQAVIDAVEEYNELWKTEIDNQKQNLQDKLLYEKTMKTKAAKAISFASKWTGSNDESSVKPPKSSAFMSDAERKEQQKLKQQADQSVSAFELDPEVERKIAEDVIASLFRELLLLTSLSPDLEPNDLSRALENWNASDILKKERNSEEISGTLFRESTPSIRNSVIGRRGSVEKRLQPTEENSYAIELLYILKVTSDICGVGM